MIAALIGLPRWARGLGLIVIGVAVWFLWLHFHDAGVIDDHETKREAAAAGARETAGAERAADAVNNTRNEEQNHAAINAAPGGALSPAAHALACERLRKLGRIPAACRPPGGDGEQAGPR